MSREMQIEEMAEYIYGNGITHDTAFHEDCRSIARDLYNAGYRKQSEGEWEEADTIDDGWTQYRCSNCDWHTESYYKEKHDLHRFCPNCGAKMKGV